MKLVWLVAVVGFACWPLSAQDRLKGMPGYQRHQRLAPQIASSVELGSLTLTWTNEGEAFTYRTGGKRYLYDIALRQKTELIVATNASSGRETAPARPGATGSRRRPNQPARARQFTSATSPDGKFTAVYRDRNLWLKDNNRTNEVAITSDGSDRNRVKYGSASWVYGEELFQNTAIWWDTNSQRVAFYRFDESQVPDYYVALDQTKVLDKLEVEPYVKAGGTNPIVDLLIYDVNSQKTLRVDVRSGQLFDDACIGHYVYGIAWSNDGKELLFHRTNRRQNIMDYCAADPETGRCRVIVREEWPASWVENSPTLRFLEDGRRFIWVSERTGWKNFYLYDLSGQLLATLTRHTFEVGDIVKVDEKAGMLHYLARDGDNPMKLQLHRVHLDGTGDQRLTDPAFHHSIDLSPNGTCFIDIAQTHDTPPVTTLRDADGNLITTLTTSDLKKFRRLGLKPVELLSFKSADGRTDLYGLLHFPSNFKPFQQYPLLVSIYAGPETSGARETFTLPDSLTEYGFLVASFDSRSAGGRGKRSLDAIYQALGVVEIDDQAAGVKSLWNRHYLNKQRVGIFGVSYGGTASAMCLLRYPDVFHAACSSSPVTDFRNYDSIYTERYLWIPQESPAAYDAVSVVTHAAQLRGRLMLYYGTADDNVHPANAMQFIQALQSAGKSFEVQVGPDQGHTALNRERMMEFFIENLVPN